MNYNCPKCKCLLFKQSKTDFHCIGCGLNGTYYDMEKQAEQIKLRLLEKAPKVTCARCGIRKRLAWEINGCTRDGKSEYICHECQKTN